MHQQPDLILERQPGGKFLPRNLSALKSETKFPANRPLELLALEDRVLYSAVPLDPQTHQPEPDPATEPLNLDWQLATLEHWAELLKVDEADTIPGPLLTSVDEPIKPEKETVLVVLDKGIADFELLLNDIQSHFPTEYSLLLIDSTTDGWQQLGQYLENCKGIEEIHLFSHAVSGALQLGTSRVDLDDLLSEETSAIWQRALHQEADILLYGCDLAATPTGASFVSQFALFSGADVAASIDRTGTYVNSDWDLEFTVGQFSSESLFHSSDRLTWEGALDAQNINIPNAQNLTTLDGGSTSSVAMHSDGSYVIVWSHDWGTDWGIRAARFNADGTQNGSVFTVNQTTAGDQRYASVDMDDAGNFIVTWTSPSETPGSADIWARWFAAGSGSSSEFRVNSYTPSGQYNSSVSMAGDGRFAIAWQGNGTEDSQGIFVRLYDADRNAIGNQIFVNPTSGGSQENPVVSMNDSGQFIVAWHDETKLQYQRFDSSGNKIGNANVISSIGTARHGDVLLNNDGTVVITWQEHNGTMWDVFWQRNAADDSTLTAKTLIRSNLSTDQLAPSVDGSGAGDFVITWEAGEFSDTWGVFYQLYNSSGLASPYTFWANNNYSSGFQGNASVGVNSLEQFVVVWSGQSSFDSNDIGHNNVINRFPTPTADAGTAIENGGYNNATPGTGATGNVLGNDTDPDIGDTLSLLGVVAGSGGFSTSNLGTSLAGLYGTLILNSDGEYNYSINNSNAAVQALRTNADTLTDTFTYTVRDQGSLSATATLTITLRGRNDAPHAVADSATAEEAGGLANGTSGSNPSGNALSNDTDPDAGDTKIVSGVAAGTLGSASGNVGTAVLGAYGSLTMAADGTFSYSVDNSNSVVQALRSSSQTVTDVFTYTFRDTDGLSSTTQLTITIAGANDTPQISGLGPVSIDENSANGTVLTSASPNDVDAGETHTFSLSDDAGGRFSVNSSTGAISVANSSLLNFESATSHTITVRVTDLAGAFSEQTLTITLNDVNEFGISSITDTNGTANSLAEDSANGSLALITALATDSDGSATVNYSLDDNAGGRFAIDSSTGVVTVANNTLLDFELATSHSITVRATSSDGSFATQIFAIAITDIDEFNVTTPVDNNSAVNEVVENSAAGTLVGVTAFASDADGSNNTITYSLTNSAGGRFTINSSTGVVTLTPTSVNYEQATSHTITVRALSSDGSNRTQNFTINVLDNGAEVSGITDVNATANTYAENAALGGSVLTASATHAGSLPLTWSLTNNAGGRFAINSATGVVTLTSTLNYETGTSHTITIRADASDGSFAANNFTISVTDIDEFDVGAITDSIVAANSVAENSANGTATGLRAAATDADGSTNIITYALDNDAGGRFAINSSTGTVTVANTALLNFEAATSHSITVRATSADGSFSTANFSIILTDIDEFDVGTVTDSNVAANSVAENSANGTDTGLRVAATDADGSINTITYTLDDDAGGRFAINSSTGTVTVANTALLNFEAATSHSITVRATSADGSFSTANFSIVLTDIDEFDIGTVTDSNVAANSVAENSANGTDTGLRAAATDADGSTNTITYALDNDAEGRFAINTSTGTVTVANTALLNFEAATSHSITVRATSADGSFSTANFSIILTDIDEFDVDPLTDVDTNINSISENAANGTLVGITAWTQDADATTNTITYSLDDSAGGRFAINSSTGVVTVADGSQLNFESASSHSITVRATSADNSSAIQSFTIGVTNQNEMPTAVNDTAVAIEAGGMSNGTSGSNPTGNVLTNDSDPDNGDGKSVIGVAPGTPASASGFVGSSVAGLYGSIIINADGSYSYNLNNTHPDVQALRTAGDALVDTFTYTMADSASATSTARLSVLITGANDHPTAQWSEAGLQINSGSSNNQYVELQNFDELIAGESEFTLRISVSTTRSTFFLFSYASNSDDNEFRIYSYNGTLRLSFDDQDWNTGIASSLISDGLRHEIAVVRDSSIAQLKLFVDGQMMAQNNGIKWLVNVDSGGSAVLAQEQDSNGGSFNSQQYFSGTLWDLSFYDSAWSNNRVAAEAGVVNSSASDLRGHWTFDQLNGSQLDEQVASRHGLLKSLSGGGWVAGSPQITQTNWLNSIVEHSANGFSIGTLEASELDAGDGLTWSLSDDAGGRFTINPSTGEITIANSALVDRETAGSFQIMAVATDIAGGTIERAYTIQIRDLDEFDIGLIADGNIGNNEIAENPVNGSTIGLTALASDADATNSAITYSLDNSAGGRFAINATTGVVTVANGTLLNREAASSHTITVRASSSDGSSTTQSFSINVIDSDEFDVGPVSDINPAANAVAENADSGTLVGITGFASDQDETNNSITYSLDESAGGRFSINSSTGVVSVANGTMLNREAAGSHTITIRATSADNSSSVQSFVITIVDVDEFDVGSLSDLNPTVNKVAENSANGTFVGLTITASDLDATNNTITYTLDDSAGGRFAIDESTGVVTVANGSLLDHETASTHSITVRASSVDGSSSIGMFSIDVSNLNEGPVAIADQASASEAGGLGNASGGGSATGNVLANDLDPDTGETLTVVGFQAGSLAPSAGPVGISISGLYGVLHLNADGSYTYSLDNSNPDVEALRNSSDTLQDTFSYRISDAAGLESTSQLVLTISGANDTPEAMWSETGVGLNSGAGNNQYLQVGDLGHLLAGNEFTLRLALSTADGNGTFFSYATNSGHNELRLHLSSGKLRVFLDGQQWTTNVSSGLITDGQRHELGLTRNAVTGRVDVYLDGQLKDTRVNWKAGINLDAGGTLVLGQDQDSIGGEFEPEQAFHGTYWDLSIYSSAWDATKLRLAGGLTSHSDPDLRGHWDFDLLGGNSILDLIGGRHGSLLSIAPSAEWIAGSAEQIQADWKPRVAENTVTGTVISQLQAYDVDAGENLTWSLLDDAGGRFAIDSNTGWLSVADSELLNFEQQQTHTIVVVVTDIDGLSRQEAYTIHLADVQETGVSVPVDLNQVTNRVDENSATGATTGIQVWAFDEEGSTNDVTYSLLDDAGGRFSIDSLSGVISVLNGSLLNREQAGSHQVSVRATSADGTFADNQFTIQVADVDEFNIGPIADLDGGLSILAETAGSGAAVGIRVFAEDLDSTQNAIHYSLDNNAEGRFAIDSQTGVITVAVDGCLDFEATTSHSITVRATSQDGSFSLASFTIELSDVDEFDLGPISDLDSQDNLVPENSVVGTYTGIEAFAEDQDATHNIVSWRLLDDDGGRFSIDPATGQIFTAKSLDFETIGSIRNVRVEGLSADGSSSVVVFEIQIGDVLTESYTVFSGLELAITPLDLLLTDSEKAEKYETLTFSDVPGMGQLFVVGSQGKQAISAGELSQFAIPVGQKVIYEAPSTTSGTVTLGYSAATATGQTRTGTVTIQVEPAVVVAPAVQASSVFISSSSSSNSSSSNSDSSSASNSSSGDSSTQPKPPRGETAAGAGASGDSVGFGGTTSGAVGPLPASGGGSSDQTMDAASADGESTGGRNGESRTASGDRVQATNRSEASLQLSYGTQSGNGNNLHSSTEGTAITRVLASAASIQQQFLATAQFSEYLSKLDSALEKTPLIVGFEMPAYATAGASLFTVGYVAWLIRGGVLLTSFMSSIPSWQSFDPLPILENAGSGDDDLTTDGNDSSIAELVDSEHPASSMAVSPG